MVSWVMCPECNKPVDEFEDKCFWCGSKEGANLLNEENVLFTFNDGLIKK